MLKLNKALYSLKQSAKIWYNTFKKGLINKLNFKSLLAKRSIFINRFTSIILCIYINNIVIISPNYTAILKLKS
jgi:uncharacterized membrane protein (DUF485 family)